MSGIDTQQDRPARRKAVRQATLASGAALTLGVVMAASPAQAATFTVRNLNDSGADSLRQAVLDANAAAGADVIDFQAGLTGTITLTTGELAVTDFLDVQGPGAAVITVSGNGASRVVNVDDGGVDFIDVSISGLTLTAGSAMNGAGVFNQDEHLTLADCVITGNTAAGNGGGIAANASAQVTITGTTISGNSAVEAGGGINADGATVAITGSTVAGNSAADGAGIALASGQLTLTNSTVSGNTASNQGGGLLLLYAYSPALRHTTVAGNSADSGGGVFISNGSLSVDNTILADNTADGSPNDVDGSGTLNSLFSLIESPGTATVNDGGGTILNQDPQLGPLADNGGPTQTQKPALTSPAVNAGDSSFTPPPSTDQRGPGFPRLSGGRLDIGAVELAAGTLQFSLSAYSVNEDGVTATITVTRTGGSEGPASVMYQTADGTATQPADYLPASGTLNWADGDTVPKTFQVPIVDDLLEEGNETVILLLSNGQTAVLTIVDDDQPIPPPAPPAEVPTLGEMGKLLFAGLFGLAGLSFLRRRKPAEKNAG
ncbi:MAG TPA: choice-of-anchor Q domain-containing protein [Thermoanaerobaculia bacterium]|nr:choice-of-anchor Q domain-containing protein [Thermoanaerobaculia bacterium]